jgi:hypothetical protein
MNRIDFLQSLVQFDRPLNQVLSALNQMDWDSEQEVMILKREQIAIILQRYLNGHLQSTEVEDWANAIECREDIGYEEGYEYLLRDLIYELANPLLTRSLSPQTAKNLLNTLSDKQIKISI